MKKSIVSILLATLVITCVGCGHSHCADKPNTQQETKSTFKENKPSVKKDTLCDNISKCIDENNVNDFSTILSNPDNKSEYLLFGYIDKIEVGKDGYQYITMHTIDYSGILKEIYNYICAKIENFSDAEQYVHNYVVKYKNDSNRAVKGKFITLGAIGKFESFSSDNVPVFKTNEIFNGDLVDGISGIKSLYGKDNQPNLVRKENFKETEILMNTKDSKLYFMEIPQCRLEYNGYDDNDDHMLNSLYYCHIFQLNKIPEKNTNGSYIFDDGSVSKEYNIPMTEVKSELTNTQLDKDIKDFYQFHMIKNKK